ncbi:MAG: response regulator [Planctomycetota bacterium]
MALKVVVVDDEPHIRHVIALKMQKNGFEVLTAADGEEALDLVTQEQPDLLITDYQMPVMSGLDLCRELRRQDETAHIPILMLTARGFDLSDQEREASGILHLMSKPFSPAEVLAKVRDLTTAAANQE